jgi:photosystem II stability/assembly factor-like uncharacterized protein
LKVRGTWLGLLVFSGTVAVGLPAAANGRYPNADQLLVAPGDETHLVLRATFGILTSPDGGGHWSWICEQAVGYMGDPGLLVLGGGDLLAAFFGFVSFSSGGGCSWQGVPLSDEMRVPIDVTSNPADPSKGWILTTDSAGRQRITLLAADSTHTLTPSFVAEGFIPSTLEVARSRPQRIYVMGVDSAFDAIVYTSDDTGQSWTSFPIELYGNLPMFLSAVDPNDPDTLYVRVDDGATDHLLVSNDAGATFREVLSLDGEMLGFAVSPDGSQIAVGGPGLGVYVAEATDLQFRMSPATVHSLRCLTWTARGLFACAQESLDGWTVALSTDGAQNFSPLWHVQDLVPLECETSTSTGGVCPNAWLEISSSIGAELEPAGEPSTAPAASSESSGSCDLGPGHIPWRLGSAAVSALAVAWLVRRKTRCGR